MKVLANFSKTRLIWFLGIALIVFVFFTYTNYWTYPEEVSDLWKLFWFWKWLFLGGIVLLTIAYLLKNKKK